uniref:Uncharacterized protein n=1 Tax=Fagus sylvatica TaxID=28930 RepID=A0A2N9IFK2_FAGSY
MVSAPIWAWVCSAWLGLTVSVSIWYFDGSGRGGCCLGSVAVVLSHRRLDVGLFDVALLDVWWNGLRWI